ncbi:hypothetical protein HA402_009191 [Bradysia odoriphaga]|nr:hypothetical protein HA402_009191 [Bradysia odoriphaga]
MEGTWKKLTNKIDVYTSSAVHAGTDIDGSPTYVARAPFTNQIIPGKLVVRQDGTLFFFYCYGGGEFLVDNKLVEFLVNDGYCWEKDQRKNGEVPANAIIGGKGVYNMSHYIGRAYHERVWIPGKIDGLNKCLFVPFDSEEHRKDEYYVLVKPDTEAYSRNSSSGCFKSAGRKINIKNFALFKLN